MKKTFCLKTVALFTVALIFVSCMPRKYTAQNFLLFDTDSVIVGYEESKADFDDESNKLYEKLEYYDKLFDIYNEYNGLANLKTVNDNAGVSPVEVDDEIIELIDFAKNMYEITNGKVNIAMGSVLKIWHDFREGDGPVPEKTELIEAEKHTDIDSIIVDRENSTVYISDPLCSIDVGAVAKGWSCEKIAKEAEKDGKSGYGISIGGNVRVTGEKPDGAWEIGIRNPKAEEGGSIKTVEISNGAAVTSGTYIRYREVDGVCYHHIIDPGTLFPSDRYLSVTVIYEDSGVADALSTALFNMTEEEGRNVISVLENCEVIWIYPDMKIIDTSEK